MSSRGQGRSVDQELQDLSANVPSHEISNGNNERTEQQLERADGGAVAWRNLCAAFMVEALLWGSNYDCIPDIQHSH